MEFTVRAAKLATIKTDCLVIPVSEQNPLTDSASEIDLATGGLVSRLLKTGDFKSKLGNSLLIPEPTGLKASRLLLIGCGKESMNEQDYLKLANSTAKALVKSPATNATLFVQDIDVAGRNEHWKAQSAAQAIEAASYLFNPFKSKHKKPVALKKVTLVCRTRKQLDSLQQALHRGSATARGVNIARELGDLPGNICTPSHLAKQARGLARKHKNLSCKVLDEKAMAELGMNSLLSVTAGTTQPAKMIVMEYRGAAKNSQPVVLVGKGVTFDSGGISIKSGAGMDEMKYDMCGAASVFGALNAAVELELPVNVVGIIPSVENMPGGKATKPGDIVKSMSGQTIEILNTDAEGRLILCDALTYAAKFKPDVVIDIATLTGACIMALGHHASGLFSNSDELADKLLDAGQTASDRAWRMPIWPEYNNQLKSNFADMANIGGRGAGSSTAACFLGRFTKEYNWAHLDIAGTAWNSGANKGATGRPVPLLVQYLLDRVG